MHKISPEIIDLILYHTNTEIAFEFPEYLSKSTKLKLIKNIDPKVWIFEGNTKHFNIVEKYINFDWSDDDLYSIYINTNSLKEYKNKMNLNSLLKWQPLTSNFIETLIYKFERKHWESISRNQCLSEEFIIKYENLLNIKLIMYDVIPSDSFIERFKDKIKCISLSDCVPYLPEEFIRKYERYLDILYIAYNNEIPLDILEKYIPDSDTDDSTDVDNLISQPITEDILDKYRDKFYTEDGHLIVNAINFSEEFIIRYAESIVGWNTVSKWENLKLDFIDKYQDYVDWHAILSVQNLTDSFIETHKNRIIGNVQWTRALLRPSITEAYIEEYIDKFDWSMVNVSTIYNSSISHVSEKFLIKYSDKVNWYSIYSNKKLSEVLIRQHIHINFNDCQNNWRTFMFTYWDLISQYQTLSESFIEEFKSRLNWYEIDRRQTHLSKKFREKFREEYYLDL